MLFGLVSTSHERNCAAKQAERQHRIESLPAYNEPLTPNEIKLLGLPAKDAVALVHSGDVKPQDLLKAYGKQALAAQRDTNCITEIMIDGAEKWAKQADTTAPLAGFPISMKDTVCVKGYDSTVGYSKHCFKPHQKDSPLIRMLKDLGAVPFVKTNIPMTLLSFESYNDVWGITDNPHKKGYAAGGSTGGEAALLAYGGSRLGIGTDVAGSVRLPAHFSGCYTIRCSTQRFPRAGNSTSMPGQEGIPAVYSPMTRTLPDLRFFLKALVDQGPWNYDYTCVPMPWMEPVMGARNRIGVMWTDGLIDPSPACHRALKLAVDALKAEGHEIVEFKCPRPLDGLKVASQLLMSDAAKIATRGMFYGEKNDVGVQHALDYQRLPRFIQWIYRQYVRYVRRDVVWADLLEGFNEKTIIERWDAVTEREKYRSDFYDAWKAAKIDFLLTVPNPTPAFPHYGLREAFSACFYTFLFNLVDYSAGVLPVTHVDRKLDALPKDFNLKKLNRLQWGAYVHYDSDKMHGLPVGVQVVGRKLEEEKVIVAMEKTEAALRKSGVKYKLLNDEQ